MYKPQEDSFLLSDFVKKHARGAVLDMGTGTGIQAKVAAKLARVKKVVALDIDSESLAFARKNNAHNKIRYAKSDLFSSIAKKKFDTLIFNAPYLPQDGKIFHPELEGGKEGHEVIARFLQGARKHLEQNGIILLVASSLTPHLNRVFDHTLFTAQELGKEPAFFEDIIVYKLTSDPRVDELARKGIHELTYFAHGKRGIIFTGKYLRKKVAVKLVRRQSASPGTIAMEARALIEVNKHQIGPRYIFHTKDALVYEFVEGKHLEDSLSSQGIKRICKKVFEQCYALDKLRINKQEMTRPMKHVLVNKNKITLIDFERARKVEDAHNVTQFCQFVGNQVMRDRKQEWIMLAQEYSKHRNERVFKKMLLLLS